MRIYRIDIERTYDCAAALEAFQAVFPSCVGPTYGALCIDDPAAISAAIGNEDDVPGTVEADFFKGELITIALVSVTSRREFAVPRNAETQACPASIIFGGKGSERAAAEVLRELANRGLVDPGPSVRGFETRLRVWIDDSGVVGIAHGWSHWIAAA